MFKVHFVASTCLNQSNVAFALNSSRGKVDAHLIQR